MRTVFFLLMVFLLAAGVPAGAQPQPAVKKSAAAKPAAARPTSIRGVPVISRDPYLGLIAIDGATGKALIEENADVAVYPASVIKLMNLFVVLDRVQQGTVRLTDPVAVTPEMAGVGGSQVYLDPKESFTVEELIYALMVQSANDAATALAIHVAGSPAAFVELMNQKAQALGLTHTRFFSCHGLPPTPPRKPQEVDVSTPRELAMLGRALVASHPEVLQYTSTRTRTFRPAPKLFEMRNHNVRMLTAVAGLDGLKTGYFEAAGYSTVVTALRNGQRVFVVVAGSQGIYGRVRDKAATEALNRAFAALPPPPPPPPPPVVTNVPLPDVAAAMPPAPEPAPKAPSNWRTAGIVLGGVLLGALGVAGFLAWRRRSDDGLFVGNDRDQPRRPLPPSLRR
jgi:D-alanyl-D-alanine carboxypeptidase (penicillin-binding protein 5/6)